MPNKSDRQAGWDTAEATEYYRLGDWGPLSATKKNLPFWQWFFFFFIYIKYTVIQEGLFFPLWYIYKKKHYFWIFDQNFLFNFLLGKKNDKEKTADREAQHIRKH